MYHYEWDRRTRGYKLTTQQGKFVATEIRPVYAEELNLIGFDKHFTFDASERRPFMWAKNNVYIYNGEEVARLHKTQLGRPLDVEYLVAPKKLQPVDVDAMVKANDRIMKLLVADTLKKIKGMYERYKDQSDVVYIGFSGGKDSVVLLDLCNQVLPAECPVIFSDTDMELPDTYRVWDEVQIRYKDSKRRFLKAKNEVPALDSWYKFGPPSRSLRWCCSVYKSAPVEKALRDSGLTRFKSKLAYVGVRADESLSRASYDEIGEGVKNSSQINAMPILSWGAHELFLYLFEHDLIVNRAYRFGLPRIGCVMCPEAADKYAWFVNAIYPGLLEPYKKVIVETSSKAFKSNDDIEQFFADSGWQARKSGVLLKTVIQAPSMVRKDRRYLFSFDPVSETSLGEWLKTLGTIVRGEDGQKRVLSTNKETVEFEFRMKGDGVVGLEFFPDTGRIDKMTQKYVRTAICKTLGCISCRACEVECPTGALSFDHGVHVDSTKCIHCMRCHSTEDGCMRYYSLRYAGGTTMNISGINKYMNFGLKEDWVNILIQDRENFRSTTELGNRMIPSAVTWFREASLISDATAITPTKLLEVAANGGADESNDQLWSMIWFSLANKSPLIRWFVCATDFGTKYTPEELNERLHKSVEAESVRKGALQSLSGTLRHSPLGMGSQPVVSLEAKGSRVVSVTRTPKSVDPYALLFALYLMGKLADRTSFTVSEMLTADFDSPFISPLVAFGMSVDEFKAQCLGLSSVRPDFLSCSFTLGLDEIKIFPNEKSTDDVLGMILGE